MRKPFLPALMLALSISPAMAELPSAATWSRAMQQHERLVLKAAQVRDASELKRQVIELRGRSGEPASWPDNDKWNLARVYCATMAQELANFADDKLKGSARGEIAAEASMKAYRDAGSSCKRGLAKAK